MVKNDNNTLTAPLPPRTIHVYYSDIIGAVAIKLHLKKDDIYMDDNGNVFNRKTSECIGICANIGVVKLFDKAGTHLAFDFTPIVKTVGIEIKLVEPVMHTRNF